MHVPTIDYVSPRDFREEAQGWPVDGGGVVMWEGEFDVSAGGTYQMYVRSAGAATLWVDGAMLIDIAAGGGRVEVVQSNVTLREGAHGLRAEWVAPVGGAGQEFVVKYSGADTGELAELVNAAMPAEEGGETEEAQPEEQGETEEAHPEDQGETEEAHPEEGGKTEEAHPEEEGGAEEKHPEEGGEPIETPAAVEPSTQETPAAVEPSAEETPAAVEPSAEETAAGSNGGDASASACECAKIAKKKKCTSNPMCRMSTSCGCMPKTCSCGDDQCIYGGARSDTSASKTCGASGGAATGPNRT